MDVSRPVRSLNLTVKLKDTANASTPELSFQHKAVQDYHSRPKVAESNNAPIASNQRPPAPVASSTKKPSTAHPSPTTVNTTTSQTISAKRKQPESVSASDVGNQESELSQGIKWLQFESSCIRLFISRSSSKEISCHAI